MAMYQTIVYSQWNGEGSNLTWDAGLELFWLLGGECSGLAAWSQHSISFSLTTSANISKFIPYAPKSETIYFSRKKKKKLTAEVHARMKITSGGRRRDYEQVKLPEYVRVLIMLFFLFLY